jgi:hypothetical protein
MTLIAVNPTDGSELARYEQPDSSALAVSLDRAQAAFIERRARPLAEHAEAFLAPWTIEGGGVEDYVRHEPLGIILRRHAVELPLRPGLPFRAARARGRQRVTSEARVERPELRHQDRGAVPRGRLSGPGLPDAARGGLGGCGRELGEYGLRELVDVRSVAIHVPATAPAAPAPVTSE